MLVCSSAGLLTVDGCRCSECEQNFISRDQVSCGLVCDKVLVVVARRGKSGGIWACSAQKDLRLQKDYANSNYILLEMCREVLSQKDSCCWEKKFLLYDTIMIANLHDSFFIPYIPQEICRRILITELRCPEG